MPQYDKETLAQLRFIEIEKKVSDCRLDIQATNLHLTSLTAKVTVLDKRLDELESARGRQMRINEQADDNFNELMDKPPTKQPKKWFWKR